MERKEIKKLLPTGYRKVLADKTGYSKVYIDMWFSGKSDNIKVENAAMSYLVEILEERKILTERIKAAL